MPGQKYLQLIEIMMKKDFPPDRISNDISSFFYEILISAYAMDRFIETRYQRTYVIMGPNKHFQGLAQFLSGQHADTNDNMGL
jgi:hypothetical protein